MDGRVSVRDRAVGLDYVLRDGDWVTHTVHRHEPPVTAEPILVVHDTAEYVRSVKRVSVQSDRVSCVVQS